MKVAVIGAGNIGARHISVMTAEPEVDIVGIVTPSPERASAAARRWSVATYPSHEALLEREQPEAVWVCVPPWAHGPTELALVERGIPFFIEKPLSADRDTAERIGHSLAGTGIVAAVGYHWRAMDTMPEARETLVAHPARMVLGAWHDATPPPEWWRHQATSGGQVVEQATHLFDAARYLVGEAGVISATATHYGQAAYPDSDVAEVSAALLRFANSATGVFTATCLLGGLAAQHVQVVSEGLLVTVTQKSVMYDTGRTRREVLVGNDPFVTEDRAFLEAIRQGDASLVACTYEDALRTHRLCFDVLEASAEDGLATS